MACKLYLNKKHNSISRGGERGCCDKEVVFSPLYILASFVKDKVSIGTWIYLWAFYFVPLTSISVLCQYHTVLMTVAL